MWLASSEAESRQKGTGVGERGSRRANHVHEPSHTCAEWTVHSSTCAPPRGPQFHISSNSWPCVSVPKSLTDPREFQVRVATPGCGLAPI